jgi:hypothetical protein
MGFVRVGQPRPLEGDKPGVIASIDVGEERHEIWYRVSEGPIASDAQVFLAAILPSAMMLGWPLEIPGPVSLRLTNALSTIQIILRSWVTECREVPLRIETARSSPPAPGRLVASFFSGGVDSFYTLLKHRDEIGKIILVHGFDLRLEDMALRAKVSTSLREVAEQLGVRLVEVETNVRSLADRYFPWKFYHGSMLASVALLLAPQMRKIYIAASDSYATLVPWGSHPLLDPLWSTEETELVHDGLEANRLEKVASIASSDVAMRYLRVCFPWSNGAEAAYNCGHCEKCLNTMACLRSAGALGRCTTFPPLLDLAALARLPPVDEFHRLDLREVLRSVEVGARDPELADALRAWLEGRFHRGIRSVPKRAFNKARRLARSGLEKLRSPRHLNRPSF